MVGQRTEEGSDPNAPWTVILGLTGAILTVVIVMALESAFYHVNANERERKVVNVASDELLQIRATQIRNVTSYRYVDATKGVVAIPVEKAMELVRDELRGTSRGPRAALNPGAAPVGAAASGASAGPSSTGSAAGGGHSAGTSAGPSTEHAGEPSGH